MAGEREARATAERAEEQQFEPNRRFPPTSRDASAAAEVAVLRSLVHLQQGRIDRLEQNEKKTADASDSQARSESHFGVLETNVCGEVPH
jgi:hypothetical protein